MKTSQRYQFKCGFLLSFTTSYVMKTLLSQANPMSFAPCHLLYVYYIEMRRNALLLTLEFLILNPKDVKYLKLSHDSFHQRYFVMIQSLFLSLRHNIKLPPIKTKRFIWVHSFRGLSLASSKGKMHGRSTWQRTGAHNIGTRKQRPKR